MALFEKSRRFNILPKTRSYRDRTFDLNSHMKDRSSRELIS